VALKPLISPFLRHEAIVHICQKVSSYQKKRSGLLITYGVNKISTEKRSMDAITVFPVNKFEHMACRDESCISQKLRVPVCHRVQHYILFSLSLLSNTELKVSIFRLGAFFLTAYLPDNNALICLYCQTNEIN